MVQQRQARGFRRMAIAAVAGAVVLAAAGGSAVASVVFGDFETGTVGVFGSLTNPGVGPWTPPVNGAVITAPASSGALTGSKVLELTGSASFNFGQSSGAALGYDFLGGGMRSAFLANNQIEFDWLPVPNGSSAGFSQLYNVILNSQGGGFATVDGYGGGNANMNQFYFTGYTGNVHHIVVNYDAYKSTILASANPDAGGWLQFGVQPNAGGGAPADMYFDNFTLSTAAPTPEPASIGLLGIAGLGLLARRRRTA